MTILEYIVPTLNLTVQTSQTSDIKSLKLLFSITACQDFLGEF